MARRWRLAPGADPALHTWGDECVVHHALSNDTYRLAGDAGRILSKLADAAATGTSGPGVLVFDDPASQEVLEVLADLGLVEAC